MKTPASKPADSYKRKTDHGFFFLERTPGGRWRTGFAPRANDDLFGPSRFDIEWELGTHATPEEAARALRTGWGDSFNNSPERQAATADFDQLFDTGLRSWERWT